MLLSFRNSINADIEYTAAQLIFGMTLWLSREFMDSSSSPMDMDLNSYTNGLTNMMRSVKLVTRPQSIDILVGAALRYSAYIFILRDSFWWLFEMAYEGPLKFLQSELKYCVIDKKVIKYGFSINRLKAAYLEGNFYHVRFHPITMPSPLTEIHDETSLVSDELPKTKWSGRSGRFLEQLNYYCAWDTTWHLVLSRPFALLCQKTKNKL